MDLRRKKDEAFLHVNRVRMNQSIHGKEQEIRCTCAKETYGD